MAEPPLNPSPAIRLKYEIQDQHYVILTIIISGVVFGFLELEVLFLKNFCKTVLIIFKLF